jgi:hypothetical protein
MGATSSRRISCGVACGLVAPLALATVTAGASASTDHRSRSPFSARSARRASFSRFSRLTASGPQRSWAAAPRREGGLVRMPLVAQALLSRTLGQDASGYQVRASATGLRLKNPRQGLAARFSDAGVQVHAGSGRLGLTLTAYGYGRALRSVAPAQPRASKNRVVYRRGSLAEWYENGPLGLEQSFGVHTRPAGRNGPLTLAISLSGNLRGSLSGSRNGLVFSTKSGRASLRYRGFAAFTADGHSLRSWLELRGRKLLLRVDDRRARYPLTIDPYIQEAKLTVSDGYLLGHSVAVDGNTIVTGGGSCGVCVFVEPAGGWANANRETARLTASDGGRPGFSVAISGDTIVAGAPDIDGTSPGAVYVWVKPASGWADMTQTAKLTASDLVGGERLGIAVAISGSTVAAGADFA